MNGTSTKWQDVHDDDVNEYNDNDDNDDDNNNNRNNNNGDDHHDENYTTTTTTTTKQPRKGDASLFARTCLKSIPRPTFGTILALLAFIKMQNIEGKERVEWNEKMNRALAISRPSRNKWGNCIAVRSLDSGSPIWECSPPRGSERVIGEKPATFHSLNREELAQSDVSAK